MDIWQSCRECDAVFKSCHTNPLAFAGSQAEQCPECGANN